MQGDQTLQNLNNQPPKVCNSFILLTTKISLILFIFSSRKIFSVKNIFQKSRYFSLFVYNPKMVQTTFSVFGSNKKSLNISCMFIQFEKQRKRKRQRQRGVAQEENMWKYEKLWEWDWDSLYCLQFEQTIVRELLWGPLAMTNIWTTRNMLEYVAP